MANQQSTMVWILSSYTIYIDYNLMLNIFLFSQGDLMNEDEVLEWLTSVESMDLPDRIEEVNAKILQNYIDEHDLVAVLFCK